MRIAVLPSWLSTNGGGIWEVAGHLARALAEGGSDEVTLVGPADERTPESLDALGGVRAVPCASSGPERFGYARGLLPALRALEPDVVHAHGIWRYSALAALRWHRETGRPLMVSPHGNLDAWALARSRAKKAVVGAWFQRPQLEAAACVHALTAAELRSVRDYCGGGAPPVAVVPNGVWPPAGPVRRGPRWRGAEVPAGARVLLFFGRLSPQKGLESLLRAWAQLRAGDDPAMREWHLVVAGWSDGEYGRVLKALSDELGIGGTAHFVGPQFHADREATFAAADAFVLSSVSEGLPMTVLEAWSFSLPVLMTEACNLPGGFRAGAAYELPPTLDGLAAALRERLAGDAAELKETGRRGRELVEREFAWTRIAEMHRSVYSWTLNGGPRPAFVSG